jgi:hypothetical protein
VRSRRLSAFAKIAGVNRRVKMVAAVAAVALLLAGGAIAAVSATGRGTTRHPRAGLRLAGGRDVRTASSYLGIPATQLESELRSGESLAQIAQAKPGHSVAALVDALVAAKRARLAKAGASLPARVQAEVARIGGPGGGGFARGVLARGKARSLFGGPAHAGVSAASYIGISAQLLRSELETGKTLAQIASAHDRSEAGLIAVLVKARKQAFESALLAGAISQQRETALLAKLESRVRKLVKRSFGASPSG